MLTTRQDFLDTIYLLAKFYIIFLTVLDISLLLIFIPTFFFVSLTPGMCMTLAMTLGMTIGVRRTGWMMLGELLGVATVALFAVLGVSAIMLKYPLVFNVMKFAGAAYLLYIGVNMWRSKGKLAVTENNLLEEISISRSSLFNQGFITAIANPKGWAFMVSLLPPFINTDYPLPAQLCILIIIILISELVCMTLYAAGGKTIGKVLTRANNIKLLNRISGSLMVGVATWLAIS
jgi:homoserine/homoserine lactone efflux protein